MYRAHICESFICTLAPSSTRMVQFRTASESLTHVYYVTDSLRPLHYCPVTSLAQHLCVCNSPPPKGRYEII